MVATDVASRGIGMLDCIFVSPPFLHAFLSIDVVWLHVHSSALCDGLLCLSSRLVWAPDVSLGSLVRFILESECSVACYVSHSVLRTNRVQRRIGIFLIRSSCIFQGFRGP